MEPTDHLQEEKLDGTETLRSRTLENTRRCTDISAKRCLCAIPAKRLCRRATASAGSTVPGANCKRPGSHFLRRRVTIG